MKKSKFIFSTVAAAATLLAGCSETTDWLNNGSDNVDVQLTATSGTGIALTRAADGIYESTTGFDGGEHVQVYMKDATTTSDALYTVGSPQKDNSTGVMKSDLTAVATPMRYPTGPSGSVSLYAVYPATSTSTHTVAHDQIADANYKQSDLMYGAPLDGNGNITAVSWNSLTDKAALATTSMPNLVFRHQLIKLKVVLVKAPDVKQVTQVKMLNVKRSVSVTPSETALALGAPTTAADALGDEILIGGSESTTTDQAKTYIYCCVFPAQAWDDEDFLAITADSYTTTYRLKRDSWAMGNEYTVTINLNELALGSTIDIGEWGDAVIDQTPTVAGGSLKIEEVADQTYRGTAYNLTPAVSYKGTPLTSGTDFEYSYFGTTNAGTAVILVTGKDDTAYEGKMGVCQFNILPRSLVTNSDDITIEASNPLYDGGEHTNTFTLTDAGLATGTDYVLTTADYNLVYDDGISSATNYATTDHPVTITGIGNYCDTKNVSWNITRRPVTITAVAQVLAEWGTKSGLTASGTNVYTNYVTVDELSTTVGLLSGNYISEVTLTFDGAITPSDAVILNASGVDVTSNYNITYEPAYLAEWVDIGLSVLWAPTNVGAANEEDYGLYFHWAGIVGYPHDPADDPGGVPHEFIWQNAPYSGETEQAFTEYTNVYIYDSNIIPSVYTDLNLVDKDDAVKRSSASIYKMDGRMPTYDEAMALVNTRKNTTDYKWEYFENYKDSGHGGIKITRKDTGKYIYIPMSGFRKGTSFDCTDWCTFWTSLRRENNKAYAYGFAAWYSGNFYGGNTIQSRGYGFPVRAVKPKTSSTR